MQAYVIRKPGGAENLELNEIPTPEVKSGWILIQVKAFGINRAEWFTRRGDSPSVIFPRVLGIECVGVVAGSQNPTIKVGQKVAALMGGMGREFDGSYAEYTLVPESSVLPFESNLDWQSLGALPEMLQTIHGSLFQSLEIRAGQTLLIRGGTSSIGLCALEIARNKGLKVISSTRSNAKVDFLKGLGATEVVLDKSDLSLEIRELHPEGIDRVLELVGAITLIDSLKSLKRGGIACMTGILGGAWAIDQFKPMENIPTAVKLTSYSGEAHDLSASEFQGYLNDIEHRRLNTPRVRAFPFSELQQAHRLMDSNDANGKIVVVI